MIKEKIYELKRYIVMKHLTSNLGEVIEEENKLVCHVNKNKFKRGKYDYYISCWGIYSKDRELARKYNLDKPITYIIDNIDFKHRKISIFGHQDCEVVIRNCDFIADFCINVKGKCTLENICVKNTRIIIDIKAKELIIKNTNMLNDLKIEPDYDSIYLESSDLLVIKDSIIGDVTSNVKIIADNNLEISSSAIKGDKLKIKAKEIISSKNNWISAVEKIDLDVENYNEIPIISPKINCNGTTYSSPSKPIILNKNLDETKKSSRLELITCLKKIKKSIDKSNRIELKEYKTSLENKPIKRVLSK